MHHDPSAVPPRLVVTLGVYRSASTWVANVTAAILRQNGPTRIIAADSVAEIAKQVNAGHAAAFVVKTHRPDASLRLFAQIANLPVIVSVRDPADCVASLVAQFGERFESARGSVALSCEALLWMLPFCSPLILPYEAPEARDAPTVARIAARLGVTIDDETAASIAASFAPAEVKRLIDQFTAEGLYGANPRQHLVHAATQWHPGHLGTGQVGSHRTVLTPEQIATVSDATRMFRDRFAYSAKAA